MPNIHYYNRVLACKEGQSVLDVLLENGQMVPHSCTMGVCVTCIMQVDEGEIPEQAQAGLRQAMINKGQFLPCVCEPTSDIHISKIAQEALFSPAVVEEIEKLSPDICRIYLSSTTPLYYRAGQFLNLRREGGLVRSYSLASVPSLDDQLEFHIRRLGGGEMSNWILDDLKVGEHIGIQGPIGNCFYLPGKADQKILLIGNGTGLAPLIGIARDALSSGHSGDVYLYHGSRTKAGLYLEKELRDLEFLYKNFTYIPCISGDEVPDGYRAARANDAAFSEHPNLSGWRVFLSGLPAMVYDANQSALSAGADITDIYTDPYELKDLRKTIRST